ncbi:MAG: HEAT repeat domain-containing protein [Spirochaetota bacterium]
MNFSLKKFAIAIVWVLFSFSCKGPEKPQELPVPVKQVELPLEQLVQNLDSPQWRDRSSAILTLARKGHKQSIAKIRILLGSDKNAAVRGTAALALARFSDRDSAVPIAKMLAEDKEVAKDILLSALKTLQVRETASYIVPVLNYGNHVERLQAVEALASINNKSVAPQILQLAKKHSSLQKANTSKLKTYIMVLGKLEYRPAGSFIIEVAKKQPPSPALAAAYLALGRLKYSSGSDVLVKAIGKKFVKGRENAVISLQNLGDSKVNDELYLYLSSSQKEVQQAAATVIAFFPRRATSQKILKLLQTGRENVIGVSAFILGRHKYTLARKTMETFLQDRQKPSREALATALGWIGNRQSIPILESVLQEEKGEGRYGAAIALGIMRSEKSLPLLEKVALAGDSRLRQLAVESMAMLASPKSLPFLQEMTNKSPKMAVFTLTAIASIPGEKSLQVLLTFAKSQDIAVQRASLQAIAQKKDTGATATVIEILRVSKGEIAKNAMFALRGITKQSFVTKNEWLNWYNSIKK